MSPEQEDRLRPAPAERLILRDLLDLEHVGEAVLPARSKHSLDLIHEFV